MSDYKAEKVTREAMIETAKLLLAFHGFKMKVDGCGCCDSPWVKMTYKGEDIIVSKDDDMLDRAVFDMFDDEE